MRILVTGGAGFVGSALVPELHRQGHDIVILDWFLFPSDNPFQPSGRLTLIKGDVRNPFDVRGAMRGVDAVIHLAAMSNDPSGDLDKELTRQVNLVATRSVLEIARDCGAKRFIYASSASVYGICDADKVVESLPSNPQTIYAETKALSEGHVLAANTRLLHNGVCETRDTERVCRSPALGPDRQHFHGAGPDQPRNPRVRRQPIPAQPVLSGHDQVLPTATGRSSHRGRRTDFQCRRG